MHISRAKTAVAVTAILASTLVGGTASPAAASPAPTTACTPTWKLVPTPKAPTTAVSLESVTALAPNDVWISGTANGSLWAPWILQRQGGSIATATQVPDIPLGAFGMTSTSFASDTEGWGLGNVDVEALQVAEHWHGGRWTMTALPAPADPATTAISLLGVAAISGTDAWAVGGLFQAGLGNTIGLVPLGSMIEHWDGTAWSTVPNPLADHDGASLRAVKARSATDIWAVGYQTGSGGDVVPLVEHWDGTAWSVSPAPTGNQKTALNTVSASGANDVWAAGSQTMAGTTNTAVPLVEHWNGTAWTVMPGLPDVGNARIDSVYATGPNDAWVLVEQPDQMNLLLHWNGTAWMTTTLPGPQELGLLYLYSGLAGTGPNDVWAVGDVVNTTASTSSVTPQVAHLSCGKD